MQTGEHPPEAVARLAQARSTEGFTWLSSEGQAGSPKGYWPAYGPPPLQVLACNFSVMKVLGDRVLRPFLQDTIQAGGQTLWIQLLKGLHTLHV